MRPPKTTITLANDAADCAKRMAGCADAIIVAASSGRFLMLRLALIFFVISLVAGLFGFAGISAATSGIARILFFIAIAIFLIFLVLALLGIQAFA